MENLYRDVLSYFSMLVPDHCFRETSIRQFMKEAGKDRYLEGLLSDAFDVHQKNMPGIMRKDLEQGEKYSWRYSLPALAEVIDAAAISGNQRVILEGIVQTSDVTIRRIDALLLGANEEGRESALVLELKRWNPTNGFTLSYASQEEQDDGLIKLHYDGEEWTEENPLLKVAMYRNMISCRINELCGEAFIPRVGGYAYFHNCKENIPQQWKKVLKSWRMKNLLPKNYKDRRFPPLITGNQSNIVTDIISNEIGSGEAPELETAMRKILGFKN